MQWKSSVMIFGNCAHIMYKPLWTKQSHFLSCIVVFLRSVVTFNLQNIHIRVVMRDLQQN